MINLERGAHFRFVLMILFMADGFRWVLIYIVYFGNVLEFPRPYKWDGIDLQEKDVIQGEKNASLEHSKLTLTRHAWLAHRRQSGEAGLCDCSAAQAGAPRSAPRRRARRPRC